MTVPQRRLLVSAFLFAAFLALVYWIAVQLTFAPAEAQNGPAPVLALATSTECNGAIFNQPPKLDNATVDAELRRFCHSFYEVGYSTTLRDPLWSAEHLTKAMAEASDSFGRPKATFAQQSELSADEQGDTSDYVGSGYDRGHMTPTNDAGDMDSERDTFVVTNIVPQTKVLNERLWQYLEASVHEIAERDGDVYVVTGPIIVQPARLVNGRIAVPSSTFKAIYVPSTGIAIAYVASNDDDPSCFAISLADLRHSSGVDPFPSLPDQMKATRPDFQLPHGVHLVHGDQRDVPLPNCQASPG